MHLVIAPSLIGLGGPVDNFGVERDGNGMDSMLPWKIGLTIVFLHVSRLGRLDRSGLEAFVVG